MSLLMFFVGAGFIAIFYYHFYYKQTQSMQAGWYTPEYKQNPIVTYNNADPVDMYVPPQTLTEFVQPPIVKNR
jgi:hypothetical protein